MAMEKVGKQTNALIIRDSNAKCTILNCHFWCLRSVPNFLYSDSALHTEQCSACRVEEGIGSKVGKYGLALVNEMLLASPFRQTGRFSGLLLLQMLAQMLPTWRLA